MKKLVKLAAVVLAVCTVLMVFTGCGAKKEAKVDLSKYPKDINAWTAADLKDYLVNAGIIDEEKQGFIFMDVSQNELEAMGIDSGFLYIDTTAASVMDTVFFYDPAKEGNSEKIAAAASEKVFSIEGQVVSELDCVLGGFLFSYSQGTDEDHIAAFTKALKDIEEGLGIKAALLK